MKNKIYSMLYKIFIYCIGLFYYIKAFNKACDCLIVSLYKNNYNNIANKTIVKLMKDFIKTINLSYKCLNEEMING